MSFARTHSLSITFSAGLGLALAACAMDASPYEHPNAAAASAAKEDARLLAATFGVDDFGGLGNCAQYAPIDGLPVVFSLPLNVTTVNASDFAVERADGTRVTPLCATFAPSINSDERRTILLQGYFGAAGGDDPKSVTIVGSILAADGSVDFRGQQTSVVPYSHGQHLVYARWQSAASNTGGNDQCPTSVQGAAVTQVVQLAFGSNAGTTFSSTSEYFSRFMVNLDDGSVAHPFAFGDTTADNYLELCLVASSRARSVSIQESTVTDASGQPNEVPLFVTLEN